VVPSIHGLPVKGVTDAGKNRVIRAFAAARPGTVVPDWQHIATTRPDLMQPDDLHPDIEGADVRAALIARAVRQCLAFQAGLG
jgi:lysophospholipase L1-like esterase